MIKILLLTLAVLALVGCAVDTYEDDLLSEDLIETSEEPDVSEESSNAAEEELDMGDMFAEDDEIEIGEMI